MTSATIVDRDTTPETAAAVDRVEALRARLASTFDDPPAADLVVDRAAAATAALHDVDPAAFDAAEMRAWLEGVERTRRTVEAAAVAAAGAVDRSNPFRDQGFFTAKSAVKHMCRLSGPEAHRRVQTSRLHAGLPAWGGAEADGHVGVAQSELMARVVANPRVPAAIVQRDAPALLADAVELPYDDFERHVRTWEALADPDGDRDRNDRQHAGRNVSVRPRPEGGWALAGNLHELAGCEFVEIFSWFCEAEWQADWADARARLGEAASPADLVRTEAQRRADALLAMARAAASAPADSRAPQPTTNVLIDQASFEAHLRSETPDPATYRSVVVRTQTGRRLHPDDAVNAALIGHIRRVVYDNSGTVIDLGRRSRLFRGSSRDAVMLLLTTCVWIGCDRPVAWCHADHSLGWKAHGATVPRNGGPLCGGHNHLKERGFRVIRDDDGDWHVIAPDGTELT
jgi:hypothetical protein